MSRIEVLEVSGFIPCFESLRLPFKKECRSQTNFIEKVDWQTGDEDEKIYLLTHGSCSINNNDLTLLKKLIKAGDEHAKSLRLITASFRLKLPLYIWNELVTYEVGVSKGCSESTMHTLKKGIITQDDFQLPIDEDYLQKLNNYISEDKPIDFIKNALPNGYLQERVITFSYQTLQRIVKQRKSHKLSEWKEFINVISKLPLANELIF